MGTVRRKINKIKRKLGEKLSDLLPRQEESAPPEPDLITHLQFVEVAIKALTAGGVTCVPEEVKVYRDRVWLNVSEEVDFEMVSREFTCPLEEGQRYVSFELGGQTFRWDVLDQTLRFTPDFDPGVCVAISPQVCVLDSRVLRVEKEYALHNLSERCLAYAFAEHEDSFDWCIPDRSCVPVVFELNSLFYEKVGVCIGSYLNYHVQDNYSFLLAFAMTYCDWVGINANNLREIYKNQLSRTLWSPGDSSSDVNLEKTE